MKYFKILLLLLLCATSYSQDYKTLWSDAIQNELDGKTETAYKKVQEIYTFAKKDNNEEQIIKCFFYISKFRQVFEEKAPENIISNLREEIKTAKPTSKAILNYIYGTILEDYYNYHSYKINTITAVKDNPSANLFTWSKENFKNEITKSFQEVFTKIEKLNKIPIDNFKEILEIPSFVDGKNYSLYELLLQEISKQYIKLIDNRELNEKFFTKNEELKKFYATTNDFLNVKNDTYPIELISFITTLQQKERLVLKTKPSQIDKTRYQRLLLINQLFHNTSLLENTLNELLNTTSDKDLYYEITLRKTKNLIEISTKEDNSNSKIEAIQVLEKIIKENPNEYVVTEAQLQKETILDKFLQISLEKINYEGENNRASVDFKNIDNLKVSYYPVAVKDFDKFNNYDYQKTQLISKYLETKKPFLETIKSLPNPKNHHQYSTEILMDKVPLGHYIIAIEDTDKSSNTTLNPSYALYHISNISYVKDENKTEELFYVLHRKTGKPLNETSLLSDLKTSTADANGKITYTKPSNKAKNLPPVSYLIHQKDTLSLYFNPKVKDTAKDKEDEFEARANIYLDRAIYRPGQKVYFKGLIIQNKNKIKSVVPFVTAHITIEDASYKIIKEFDLQTNEFGTFTGEFDLPKNCLTGEFSIEIEEPDNELFSKDTKYYNKKEDEHSFWDNANIRSDNFHFKVEEYKRPTFEITVDKIKEIYSIGDSLTIKGYAKNLAGNNLTNAQVKYSISRNFTTSDYKYHNDRYFIQKETTTGNDGSFVILLTTTVENFKNEDIKEITYTIDIDVTDTNGETRTFTKTVAVKRETLQLSVTTMATYLVEKKNTLSIHISNLDNTPIPHQGKIEYYKKESKNYLKSRIFQEPELQNIQEEEFKNLFPYEPYSEKRNKNLTLVKTITFDTKTSNEITLPKLEKGSYTAKVSITDTKENPISQERYFTVLSKENPLATDKLFAYRRIKNDDPNYIHFELSTNLSELYVTTRFYYGKEINSEQVTLLTNGKSIVSFKKIKETKYNYTFFFSTQWENSTSSENITIRKEEVRQDLNFEVVSFRNKIEPGSKENWSFKITNHKQEAEVLASMYDSSLDQFTTKNWQRPEFYDYSRVPFPQIGNYNTQEINFNSRAKKIYYNRLTFAPKLQWFGFDYNNPKNQYRQKQYEENLARPQIIRNGSKLITGIVTDGNTPIPGANVAVKGTTIGTSTGFDGKYSIYAFEGEQLFFSFMGMNDVVKTVGSSGIINTVLQDSSKKLGEVVVTALGIKREKGTFNPNILVVTSNDKDLSYFYKYRKQLFYKWNEEDEEGSVKFKKSSTLSYSVATIEQKVILRGNTSITGNNKALLIVDGEIKENLNLSQISEDDITSIVVIKDKDATALYGVKGANGVIMITTKNAIKELSQVKTRTNFNETAFFYPHLTTDTSGKIAFNFTTPESLTKWKLRLFGHTKNADFGTFETEIISQKDLMIMPNMPRFLRETDTITLAAKVVNLTQEVKSGNVVLQLFDAVTGNTIDAICLNTNNLKSFTCKAKESTTIEWRITIPEGIQGLQYKVIAKSGAFSDGEENILPVLSNKILITEALPLWVREHTKKDFVFENLKNNTSKTLKNQSFTFEYTANPTWLAIQSLPYVMEFEHECAEQTFARFYANALASKIINSQPKVTAVFEKWRNNPEKKSKLEMNEELKSVVLRETPWLLETDETEKNKRIAALFDLQKLQTETETALDKLKSKQLPSGGFPWFDGGRENYNVTQHVLSGLGHLQKMIEGNNFTPIINKGIPFIDQQFMLNTQNQRKYKSTITTTELQYLYCRSFYAKSHPIANDSLKKAVDFQIQQVKTNWLQLSLPQKAMVALALNRLGDNAFAQKIITHLKETAVKNADTGMYWISNKNGYSWFDAAIENQALLIEAFAEIDNDTTLVNQMKVWLINQKQRESWGTTKATTEAIYALLFHGINFADQKVETNFTIGNPQLVKVKLTAAKTESEAGYFKIQWKSEEVSKELATITIENKSDVPSFGGVYWQYFENLEAITTSTNKALNITKEVYKKVKDSNGTILIPLQKEAIRIGDIITTRLIIKADTNLEFVHLKDLRASCFEPIDVLSEYEFKNDISYYRSTKDAATHFFFDTIKQGSYILEYDVRVNNTGVFNNGIATLQSMYAPEFSVHSSSQRIEVITK